jgi:hypothetical protein
MQKYAGAVVDFCRSGGNAIQFGDFRNIKDDGPYGVNNTQI